MLLLFLHTNRETSVLVGELPEESDQSRFRSVMRVTIPLDLSHRPFIPLPCFIHTRNTTPRLTPALVLFPQSSDEVSHDV